MKEIFAILFFILTVCDIAVARNSFPELEIVKEIKLLESDRSDVKTIMSEFNHDDDDNDEESYHQEFFSDNAKVLVAYSTGDCSEPAGTRNQPEWNVPKMTATKVVITFYEATKLKDLGLNLSKFKKRLDEEDNEDSQEFIYYDEKAGIIILTDEGEVEKIILHPLKNQISKLCRDEENDSELFSEKVNFVDSIIRSDTYCILINQYSNVTSLDLQTKTSADCEDGDCFNAKNAKKEISVITTAVDPENDVLTYNYTVTGGKINGVGSEVVWDLTGVPPGSYTITAGTDDSCGVCGQTISREVLVKEDSYELIPLASVKIKDLILDKTELIAACPVGRLRRKLCPAGGCGVSITSVADTPDNQNITYRYKTSAGKIIGSGISVIWDLTGLPTGTYSVEVTASKDGTVFGIPKTATVEIKENPSCVIAKR